MNFWAEKFRSVGLDPAIHIVNGNKKDNFWMMGETGRAVLLENCMLTYTRRRHQGGACQQGVSAECIEIWNLVFIQFNADQDGSFCPLPTSAMLIPAWVSSGSPASFRARKA